MGYILQIFREVVLVVKDQSDLRNLPMLVQFVQDRAPQSKLHLTIWQLSPRRVVDFRQCCIFPCSSVAAQTQQTAMGAGL